MMSPIAIQSAKASAKAGFAVKGTGRRRTTYARPPVRVLIEKCGSIHALRRLRGSLAYGSWLGKVNPSEKTEREWERAFWKRVIELILSAPNAVEASFIYNTQLTWLKPPSIELAVKTAAQAAYKSFP